jgi:hypothetical protein
MNFIFNQFLLFYPSKMNGTFLVHMGTEDKNVL